MRANKGLVGDSLPTLSLMGLAWDGRDTMVMQILLAMWWAGESCCRLRCIEGETSTKSDSEFLKRKGLGSVSSSFSPQVDLIISDVLSPKQWIMFS